jgi:hypothetical protein
MTVCQSISNLLEASAFDNAHVFDVYTTNDFEHHMNQGVSLFLYRVVTNSTMRTPPGRRTNGHRQLVQLPVNLHFMLTAWAEDASMQNLILGWAMRIIADNPIIPHGILEATMGGVFQPNEIVEIVPSDMSTEDLLRLWENFPTVSYQLSVPYLARIVRLESEQLEAVSEPVQTRTTDYSDYVK